MSDKKETPVLDFFTKFFTKFFDSVNICVKSICTLLAIVCSIGLVCFTVLQGTSNQPFATSDSRLEKQLNTILTQGRRGSALNLTSEQKAQIMGELVKQYDPATDNLDPVTNPNAKPINLEAILANFDIDADKVLPKVLQASREEKRDWHQK